MPTASAAFKRCGIAASGLASIDDPEIGKKLVAAYRQFHPSERGQLVSVLVSRASFAHVLLDAVGEGKMPQADISAFHARQIRSLNDAKLNEKLTRVGGELRDASDGQRAAIAKWKAEVTPVVLAKAEKAQGRGIDPYLKRNKVERVDEGAPPLRRFAP